MYVFAANVSCRQLFCFLLFVGDANPEGTLFLGGMNLEFQKTFGGAMQGYPTSHAHLALRIRYGARLQQLQDFSRGLAGNNGRHLPGQLQDF